MAEEETTFEKFKKALLELLRGYPDYVFYGKFEFYLKAGKESVDLLDKHEIIEKISREEVKKYIKKMPSDERQKLEQLPEEDKFRWYRLAPKGVDLAVSLMNADYSKKISEYSEKVSEYDKEVLSHTRETQEFNRRIVYLTKILVRIGFLALIVGIISILPNIIKAFTNLF